MWPMFMWFSQFRIQVVKQTVTQQDPDPKVVRIRVTFFNPCFIIFVHFTVEFYNLHVKFTKIIRDVCSSFNILL